MKQGMAIGVGLFFLCAAGCEPEATSVAWELGFETPCVEQDTERVRVRVRHDGCFGKTVIFEQTLAPDMAELDTPDLDPGFYGLEAEALGVGDQAIGRGCIDVHLPLRGAGAILLIGGLPGTEVCAVRPDGGPLPFIDAGPTGCTMDAECDDDLDCTIDYCLGDDLPPEERCIHSAQPGWCAVAGAGCFPNGALNPADPCFACDTKLAYGWWPSPVGTICAAGDGTCDGIGHCR
jgi:hypothetical protein